MNSILEETKQNFRAPAFPGSFFISFEGIEGAGKSTQIILAKKFLEEHNFRVLILREPGGTSFGEKLRNAILETKTEINPLSEALLFASSRAQLLIEVILKELSVPNTIIICDRYIDSSLVYQGMARGLGVQTVLDLHKYFPLHLVPHLTFYLAIDANTSEKRQKIRNAPKDYFEAKGIEFYKNLVVGFEKICELFPQRIVKINAEESKEKVSDEIYRNLLKLLESKN